MAHGERTGRNYEVDSLLLREEAPDIRYREVTQPHKALFIEATELVRPDRKRSEEYRWRKQQRQTCEQAGQDIEPPAMPIPDEDVDVEAERQVFPKMASERLKEKLQPDYGPNCTLVLYVNLGLYGDKPISEFVATYVLPKRVRFYEMWFLYGGEVIIPLCPTF